MKSAVLRFWFLKLCEWATIGSAIVLLHVAWYLPQWLSNLVPLQLAVEIAVRVALAFTCAGLTATILTAIWIGAGGLRTPPSRFSHWISAFATGAAALALLSIFLIVGIQWITLMGLRVPAMTKMAVAMAALIFVSVLLFREVRSGGDLEVTSECLAAPSRRTVLGLWLASLGIAVFGGVRWRGLDRLDAGKEVQAVGKRPNFLLVTFDSLSAEDMSLYGYRHPTTPNIDRLAKRGIVFEKFYAASGFTTSSVTSILTGKSVPRHGWYLALNGRVPDAEKPENLVSLLKEQGYTTAAFVANPLAHPTHIGLEDGFDILSSPSIPKVQGSDFAYHLTHSNIGQTVEEALSGRLLTWCRNLGIVPSTVAQYPPEIAFDQAKAFLARAASPFFLWVHVFPPHFTYDAPAPFSGRFLPGPEYRSSSTYGASPLADMLLNANAYDRTLQPEIDKLRLRYDECVAYADASFGDLCRTAEDLSANKNMVTMVSSDHGENFSNGFWGHGGTKMWNGVMQIPLVVLLPGGKEAGTRVPGVAGHVDLAPTVLDLAGIAIPSWIEGRSLRPMWEGRETENRIRVATTISGGLRKPIAKGVVAVVMAGEKYMLDIQSGQGSLYDLASDPGETRDLASSRPVRAREMHALAMKAISNGARHG